MNAPKPISSVQEALKWIDAFTGNPEDFELAVPDALLDAVGINMAIITDRIRRRALQLRWAVAALFGYMLAATSAQAAANLQVGDPPPPKLAWHHIGYGDGEIPVLADEINALWNKSQDP